MSTVGQIEKKTQKRVVNLFRDTLDYAYLGDWTDRPGNANIETKLLQAWLKKRGVAEGLITKALHMLDKVAGDTSKSLYDRNKAVYELLRYGVNVPADVGENKQTVWLIDWKHPEKNDFAIAEEVTILGADAKSHDKRPDVVIYVNGSSRRTNQIGWRCISMWRPSSVLLRTWPTNWRKRATRPPRSSR
jgi:type I restriction enzyme R subunit